VTKDEMVSVIREAGYPIMIFDGQPHIPPYIEKLVLMSYAIGYANRGSENKISPDLQNTAKLPVKGAV
jgi:hypothetical protein